MKWTTLFFLILSQAMGQSNAFVVLLPAAGPSVPSTDTVSSTELRMKVVNSIKTLKKIPGSRVVRRRGVTFVINKTNPKAKARQGGLSKRKKKYKK